MKDAQLSLRYAHLATPRSGVPVCWGTVRTIARVRAVVFAAPSGFSAAHGPPGRPGREPSGDDDPPSDDVDPPKPNEAARERRLPRGTRALDRGFAGYRCTRQDAAERPDPTHPRRPGWRQLVKKPATATEVHDWFEMDPTIGIGVLTGEVSNVVVVDVDDLGARAERADDRDRHDATRLPRLLPHRTGPSAHASSRGRDPRRTRLRRRTLHPSSRRRRVRLGAHAGGRRHRRFRRVRKRAAATYIRTTCFKRYYLFGQRVRGPQSTRGPRA